ncbi:MAG: hypothetical protein FWG73_02715 [Planctomycetaceae bacterium]|nr:hypothetical protein [Planctomycetaceae bacterium]
MSRSRKRLQTFLEIAAIFAVFFTFGAWKTPDLNETHYISKAIHYWNPDWIPSDPFLESRDAHWTFYFAFGWLSFFCHPTTMAWIGRIVAWTLLAWSWQRLSSALIPIRWVAVPTALALAYYIESFNMAGEWLIGGIEGKSLAYPFVFFALAAILHRRWNQAGIFLGIACAFHVLVGGWATLIAGVLFVQETIRSRGRRASPSPGRSANFPWIGLVIGGLIALCGLIPGLMLDAGACGEVVRQAHQIYVFGRLPHHLVPYEFRDSFLLRFLLLTCVWIFLCRITGGRRLRLFNGFIWGTLVLAAIGMILAYGLRDNRELSATLLRFYWFRLADIAVPMGIAIGGMRLCLLHVKRIKSASIPSLAVVLCILAVKTVTYFTVTYLCFVYLKLSPPDSTVPWAITLLVFFGSLYWLQKLFVFRVPALALALFFITIVFYAPLTAMPKYADLRTHAVHCRSEPVGPNGRRAAAEWIDMCQWIEANTPRTAKFWIPRDGQTFKWHARRADVGVWKNIPQDAASIVVWRRSMEELFRYKNEEGETMTDRLLTTLLNAKTESEIAELQAKYGFDYIICAQSHEMPSHTTLVLEYENDVYALYRAERPERMTPER